MKKWMRDSLEVTLFLSTIFGGTFAITNSAVYGSMNNRPPEKRATLPQLREAWNAHTPSWYKNLQTVVAFPGYYLATRELPVFSQGEFDTLLSTNKQPFRSL